MLWFLLLVFGGLFMLAMFMRPFRWGRPFGWRPMMGRPMFWRPMPPAMRYRRRMWRRW